MTSPSLQDTAPTLAPITTTPISRLQLPDPLCGYSMESKGKFHIRTQTFKVQFLLELLVQLLAVELGICTLKVKVPLKLDCVLLDVGGAALPSRAIPCSSVPCEEKQQSWLMSHQHGITECERDDKEKKRESTMKPPLSPSTPETVPRKAGGGGGGAESTPTGGSSCYLISSSGASCSRRSPALAFAQRLAELHLRRKRGQ